MGKNSLGRKGFTLLELMVAIAILVIAASGLLMALVSCMSLNESNSNLVVAANDARYVLEEIKGLAYDDIGSYSPPSFSNLDGESASVTVTDIDSRIKEVTVEVVWTERQRSRSFKLSTRIAS